MNISAIYISICGLIIDGIDAMQQQQHTCIYWHWEKAIFSEYDYYYLHTLNSYLFHVMGDFVVTNQTRIKIQYYNRNKKWNLKLMEINSTHWIHLANYTLLHFGIVASSKNYMNTYLKNIERNQGWIGYKFET